MFTHCTGELFAIDISTRFGVVANVNVVYECNKRSRRRYTFY